MASHVKFLADESIMVATIEDPPGPNDSAEIRQAGLKFIQEKGGHIYRILDFSKTKITFDIMVNAMAEDRKAPGGVGDPNITTAFVGSAELIAFGVKALKEQKQYGQVPVELFSSVDDALVWVRAKIAEKKQ